MSIRFPHQNRSSTSDRLSDLLGNVFGLMSASLRLARRGVQASSCQGILSPASLAAARAPRAATPPRAAEQRDELASFPLTEMHPIPHGPGAHHKDTDCSGSVRGYASASQTAVAYWKGPSGCGLRAQALTPRRAAARA